MTIIEKIRAEIERLANVNKQCGSRPFTQGIAAGYADVLRFLDTLEAESLEGQGQTSENTTEKKKANSRDSESLEERTAKFKEKCYAFASEFGDVLVEDFFLYWSETKEGGRRMRWEKESTFDIHRRMCRWRNNNFGNRYGVQFTQRKEREFTNEELSKIMGWRRDD